MTNEEAVKMLRMIKRTVYLGNRKFEDAIEYAIKALSEPFQPWEVLAAQAVLSQPAEPKRGRWIGKYPVTSVCSECGFLIHDSKVKAFAYCPNCGAKMEVTT